MCDLLESIMREKNESKGKKDSKGPDHWLDHESSDKTKFKSNNH